MARKARIDAPGALHHVLQRGIARGEVFRDDVDREEYVRRAELIFSETGATCFAWALMDNHIHLVLRTGRLPLSRVMQRLATGYAMHFNSRHDRVGHLFQGRFKSLLVDGECYFDELIRYVHLNPVRAGVVNSLDDLDRYSWTGHRELMGTAPNRLIDVDFVLSRFAPTVGEARKELLRWLQGGLTGTGPVDSAFLESGPKGTGAPEMSRENDGVLEMTHAQDTRVLGGDAFLVQLLREIDDEDERRRRLAGGGWGLNSVVGWVCERLGASEPLVRAGGRSAKESRARAVCAFILVEQLSFRQAEAAGELGVSQSCISQRIRVGSDIVETEEIKLPSEPP
jgi:putative transposase